MSDGFKDALRTFIESQDLSLTGDSDDHRLMMNDRDAIDGYEELDLSDIVWDSEKEEWKESRYRDPLSWLRPVCECGSHKTYGTKIPKEQHSEWCPVKRR